MIRAQYAVISEFQRVGQSNKVDLLGLFDRVYAPSLPAQHRNVAFTALLVGEEADLGKKSVRFTIKTPAGAVLLEQRGEVVFKPDGGTFFASVRLAFEILGLVFTEYGKYLFLLELDGKELARHPLSVVQGMAPT